MFCARQSVRGQVKNMCDKSACVLQKIQDIQQNHVDPPCSITKTSISDPDTYMIKQYFDSTPHCPFPSLCRISCLFLHAKANSDTK